MVTTKIVNSKKFEKNLSSTSVDDELPQKKHQGKKTI